MFLVFIGPVPLNAVLALLVPLTYRGLSLVERGLLGLARIRRPLRPLQRTSSSASALAWALFLVQWTFWLTGRMSDWLACLLVPITTRLRAHQASAADSAERARERPRPHTARGGQQEQPRGQGEASVGAVHQLPLEIFHTEEEMRAMHSGELKKLLLEARRLRDNGVAKGKQQAPRPGTVGSVGRGAKPMMPLERREIMEELLELRGGSSGAQCAVCICAYESGDPLRVLPCGHRFHVECIDSWLMRRSAACPFCSTRID